jgi:phage baseplate assembly protein W
MRDLRIAGGDIALAGGDLALVDQEAYLRQRVATALAEPYGSDPFHPEWGSTLGSYLGLPYGAGTEALVSSEVGRVLAMLIAAQRQMITSWVLTGTKAQLLAADTIASVNAINARVDVDPQTMDVWVALTTQGGQQLVITRTVSG